MLSRTAGETALIEPHKRPEFNGCLVLFLSLSFFFHRLGWRATGMLWLRVGGQEVFHSICCRRPRLQSRLESRSYNGLPKVGR